MSIVDNETVILSLHAYFSNTAFIAQQEYFLQIKQL